MTYVKHLLSTNSVSKQSINHFKVFSHIMTHRMHACFFTRIKTGFLTRLSYFSTFDFLLSYSQKSILLFLNFSCPTLRFHDFPGLENEIKKFPDFAGFP